MKKFNITILCFLLFLSLSVEVIQAAQSINISIENRLEKMENSIEEVRRDQLNYKIEKDLLKETYGSNIQTINMVLAIVLALFTILGFFEIKSVGELKKTYKNELNNLNKLQHDYAANFEKIKNEIETARTSYLEITERYEEQNKRIKKLELINSYDSNYDDKKYSNALEYISAAIELDPEDYELIIKKALCLQKLKEYPEAINLYKEVLHKAPKFEWAFQNLAELTLLLNEIDEYKKIYDQNKISLNMCHSGTLMVYFRLIENFHKNDLEEMEKIVMEFINNEHFDREIAGWEYEEALNILNLQPNSKGKNILYNFIDMVSGKISLNELKSRMKEV